MLRDFVLANREEVLARARHRVAQRSAPLVTKVELTHGLPSPSTSSRRPSERQRRRALLRALASADDSFALVPRSRRSRCGCSVIDQILAAAVGSLVQNALKFTRRGTTVKLRAQVTADHVLIDVEDECGGLPSATHASLLRPFAQAGANRGR